MIDRRYQHQGYGRAVMREVIRRLRLSPEGALIATSHVRANTAAADLYRSLGFVPWEIAWANEHPGELFLRLDDDEVERAIPLFRSNEMLSKAVMHGAEKEPEREENEVGFLAHATTNSGVEQASVPRKHAIASLPGNARLPRY